MHAYGYTPPGGGNSIDGGTWSTLATAGPFTDDKGWTDPRHYLTIRSVAVGGRSHLVSTDSNGMESFGWDGFWNSDVGTVFPTGQCSDPACYTSLRVLPGGGVQGLVLADPWHWLGQGVLAFQGPGLGSAPVPINGGSFPNGPLSNKRGSPDCPLSGTDLCFPQIAALYESTRLANLAGSADGSSGTGGFGAAGAARLPNRRGNASGSLAWGSLATVERSGLPVLAVEQRPGQGGVADGWRTSMARLGDEMLALQDGALQAWSFDDPDNRGADYQPTTPLALSDTSVWNTGRVALCDVPGMAMSTAMGART